MASGFGKIVVGTYVEIKRSDGKFFFFSNPAYSLLFSSPLLSARRAVLSCAGISVAAVLVGRGGRCRRLPGA